MTIKNTFGFTPVFRDESGVELVDSEAKGSIIVENGEVTVGETVMAYIKKNQNDTFLVSKPTFDYCISNGVSNVVMFDPSTKQGERDDTTYGGLLFS